MPPFLFAFCANLINLALFLFGAMPEFGVLTPSSKKIKNNR